MCTLLRFLHIPVEEILLQLSLQFLLQRSLQLFAFGIRPRNSGEVEEGRRRGRGQRPFLHSLRATLPSFPPRLSLSLSQLFFICLLCLARSRSILGGYSAACDGEKGRIADERDTGHLLIRNVHKVTSCYRDNVLYRGELKGL